MPTVSGINYDWPNPQRARPRAQPDSQSSLNVRILAGTPVGASFDWSNPRGAVWPQELRTGFVRSVNLLLIAQDVAFGLAGTPGFDWPNPVSRPQTFRPDDAPNLLTGTLAVPVGSAADWPNPPRAAPARTIESVTGFLPLPLTLEVIPGSSLDWPNPTARRPQPTPDAAPPYLLGTTLAAPVGAFRDWPNPTPRRPQPVELPPPNLLAATLAAPVGRLTDWPNPPRARPLPTPDAAPANVALSTLSTPPVGSSFDWFASQRARPRDGARAWSAALWNAILGPGAAGGGGQVPTRA